MSKAGNGATRSLERILFSETARKLHASGMCCPPGRTTLIDTCLSDNLSRCVNDGVATADSAKK